MSGAMRFTISERGKGAQIAIASEGNSITIPDYATMTAAIEAVRSSSDATDWVLLGYEGASTNSLVVLGSGKNGVDEMGGLLKDDMVGYSLVRFTDMYDDRPVIRYAFINWMGEHVPAMKKAKIATNKSAVLELVGTYSVEIMADSLDEISQQVVLNKIADTSGSRHREANTWEIDPATKHKVDQPVAAPSKPRSVVPTGKQSLGWPNLDVIEDSLKKIRADAEPLTWCLCVYDHRANIVELAQSGCGDLEEMKASLQPDKAMFGFLRQAHIVDQSETVKFIFINYVGESVSPMQRGKIPTLRGAVVEKFEPYHVEVQFTDLDDLTTETLNKRIEHARGM